MASLQFKFGTVALSEEEVTFPPVLVDYPALLRWQAAINRLVEVSDTEEPNEDYELLLRMGKIVGNYCMPPRADT